MNDKTNGADGAHDNGNPDQVQQSEQARESAAKRGRTRAEERIAALDASGASASARIEELSARLEEATAQLEAAEQRVAQAESGWQRARADYANLKRRTDEQRAEFASIAGDRLLIRVLDLADDFDLAVAHVPKESQGSPWVEGIAAIDRKLRALLEAEGLVAIGGEGRPFDPQTQQAISYEDTADVPDGTVIRVLQRGFTIGDRVLRPALVAVARNDDRGSLPDPDTDDDDTRPDDADADTQA